MPRIWTIGASAGQSLFTNPATKALCFKQLHGLSGVSQDQPNSPHAHERAQVLRFRPRRRSEPQPARDAVGAPDGDQSELLDDLARYEEEGHDFDYRRRMLMNAIAAVVVVLLVGFGVWIADKIADLQREQDCLMQGRKNCAPIEVPPPRNQP
jgi:hypothetical protein